MKNLRVVVFDFDGTLIDSNEIKKNFFLDYASLSGGVCYMNHLLLEKRVDRRYILRKYLMWHYGQQYDDVKAKATIEVLSDQLDGLVASAPEIPGAIGLIRELNKRGTFIILSSNTPQASLIKILALRGWLKWFGFINGSPLPKTNFLKNFIDAYDISSNELAVIGDGDDDMHSANVVGCDFYNVNPNVAKTSATFTFKQLAYLLTKTDE